MNLQGKSRTSPSPLWRAGLLVLAGVLAIALAIRLGSRFLGPTETILVAKADLAVGQIVTPEMLEAKTVRLGKAPENAATERTQIEGYRLARSKSAGDPFHPEDFAPAVDSGSIAKLIPQGRVLATLRVSPHAAPFPELRRGDRVNVVGVGKNWSGSVAHDAHFIGWISDRKEQKASRASSILGVDLSQTPNRRHEVEAVSLLLALRPIDVVPLNQAQAVGARLSLVIHGRREVSEGHLLDLTGPQLQEVELISGDEREKLEFKP